MGEARSRQRAGQMFALATVAMPPAVFWHDRAL
jgi:hypothetical protein